MFFAAFGLAGRKRPVPKARKKTPVAKVRTEKSRRKPSAQRKGKRSRKPKREKKHLADIDYYSYQKVFKQKSDEA
jgi:hypothetical protein